jgi:hypothetical protein
MFALIFYYINIKDSIAWTFLSIDLDFLTLQDIKVIHALSVKEYLHCCKRGQKFFLNAEHLAVKLQIPIL